MSAAGELVYQDERGGPLPPIPRPGDRVRILFRIDEPDEPTMWMGAYWLGENTAGVWWTPDDDRDEASWTPWSQIVSVSGPTS